MTDTYYRLVTTTTRRDGSVHEYAHEPVTTVAGCKGVFTKEANRIRQDNDFTLHYRKETPHISAFTGRIEVCSGWESHMDLPIPDIKPT